MGHPPGRRQRNPAARGKIGPHAGPGAPGTQDDCSGARRGERCAALAVKPGVTWRRPEPVLAALAQATGERTEELLRDVLTRWLAHSFEGDHTVLPPIAVESFAAEAGISVDRDWALDADFLQIHTRAQLAELAREWKLKGDLPAKRGDAIQWLLQHAAKAKPPERLVKCKPVRLV